MVKLYLNYFPHSKMAISEHKNGHFEEIRGWLQILELGSNFRIFHHLTPITALEPSSYGNGKNIDLISLCELLLNKASEQILDKVKKFWKNPFNSFLKVCHTWWNARLQLSLFQWYRINIWDFLLQVSQSRKIERRYYEVESTLECWNSFFGLQCHLVKTKNTYLDELKSRIFVTTIAWSCEKWQPISWPMGLLTPPPASFRVNKARNDKN